MTSEIVHPIDLSYTAPLLRDPHVRRPHLLQTIVQLFDSGTDVVCVEAPSGYGKTALLLEFVSTVGAPCFATFLKPASRLAYDPVTARADLANQVHWYLTSKRLPDDNEPTDGLLRTLWNSCARKLGRERTHAYVVIDGINHIPSADRSIREAIIDLLPFGLKPFRLLLSGQAEGDLGLKNKGLLVKSFPISTFTSHETIEYLQDLVSTKDEQLRYHTTLSGVPGLLACLRQQLESSAEVDIDSFSDMESIFDAQWDLVDQAPEEIRTAIAFMVAYGYPVDSATLAHHSHCSPDDIGHALNKMPFTVYSKKADGWEFSPDLFSRFAENRLGKSVHNAVGVIVEKLLEEPDSSESLTKLPLYLEKAGDTERLLGWLDDQRLASVLLRTRTTAAIEPTLRSAITLAHIGKHDRALATYSLSRSIIQQLSQTTGIEPEIRARVALGDSDGALAVANGVLLSTQRLRLLAVAADALSNTPGFPIQSLLDEIKEISRQLDIATLPAEEAIDIATDLYPIDADFALTLLRETTQGDVEHASFEVAIAKVTLAALRSKGGANAPDDIQNNYPIPKDLLVDEKVRRLLHTSAVFYHAKTATELLNAAVSIDDASERLFIQRKWVFYNPLADGVLDVVERTVHEAITAAEFTPTATFYREITTPLPHAQDRVRAREIAAIIDGQMPIIRRKGPLVDFLRVQLCLAMCDRTDGQITKVAQRLEDLYLDAIEETDELQSRITLLAWFVAELHSIDRAQTLAEHTDVADVVEQEFDKALEHILRHSADQFEILVDALGALAVRRPDQAERVCARLNTVDRRNDAFLHVILTICSDNTPFSSYANLVGLFDKLEVGWAQRDLAFEEIAIRVATEIGRGNDLVEEAQQLLDRADQCSSAGVRVVSVAKILAATESGGPFDPVRHQLNKVIHTAFDAVIGPRDKYRVACELIHILRDSAPDVCEMMLGYLRESSLSSATPMSEEVEEGSFWTLDLLCKGACALAQSNLLRDGDVERVSRLIDNIDDSRERVRLLARLAFFLWREEEFNHFSNVVNQRIWPTLLSTTEVDHGTTFSMWCAAYPAIWLEDRDRARKGISGFPMSVRNHCTSSLCVALLNKQPSGEPFDYAGTANSPLLDYSDIQVLLHLCEETDEDFTIARVFERIADDISGRNTSRRVTQDQKAEISRRMIEIANTRLPVSRRIEHAGYQIVCKAHALRVHEPGEPTWQQLVAAGRAVTNAADRVYVLADLAFCLPKRHKKTVAELLIEVETQTGQLKTMTDKYGRYCMIASGSLKMRSPTQARRAIEHAFESIIFSGNERGALRENHLVDLAYRLDSEMPMKLATFYDDDPARDEFRQRAQRLISRHELKEKIGDARSGLHLDTMKDDPNLASAAWQALGGLHSGRMIATGMGRLREMLVRASNYPLRTSYPMYSWVLSNAMMKYSDTPQAKAYIRDLFEGVLQGCSFLFQMTKAENGLSTYPQWRDMVDHPSHAVIRVGERDKALEFLQKWLRENAEEYVTVVDPYFGPEELELVTQIMAVDPYLRIRILTSKRRHRDISDNLSAAYTSAWRYHCDQAPLKPKC